MKNLKNAIYTKFTALIGASHNSFYSAISGKLYYERAPQDATLPYAVYTIVSDVPDWNFTNNFENVRLQFNLYSADSFDDEEVEDMYTALKALYDWCSLSITNSVLVYMRRANARLSRDPEDDNWMYSVDYEVMTESTVTSASASASPSSSPSQSPSASPSESPSPSPSAP